MGCWFRFHRVFMEFCNTQKSYKSPKQYLWPEKPLNLFICTCTNWTVHFCSCIQWTQDPNAFPFVLESTVPTAPNTISPQKKKPLSPAHKHSLFKNFLHCVGWILALIQLHPIIWWKSKTLSRLIHKSRHPHCQSKDNVCIIIQRLWDNFKYQPSRS